MKIGTTVVVVAAPTASPGSTVPAPATVAAGGQELVVAFAEGALGTVSGQLADSIVSVLLAQMILAERLSARQSPASAPPSPAPSCCRGEIRRFSGDLRARRAARSSAALGVRRTSRVPRGSSGGRQASRRARR